MKIKHPEFSYDKDFEFHTFKQSFDFILAQSIFSHTSQKQITKCLSEAKKVMTPTSLFVATFVKGDKNYTEEQWVFPSCATYAMEFITSIVSRHGLSYKPLRWKHPNDQTWMVITFKENINNIPEL